MLDYLVLRTGWTDEMVLNNPHCSNKRKFRTYKAMDKLQSDTPILAIPLIGDSIKRAASIADQAKQGLFEAIGVNMSQPTMTIEESDDMKKILEREIGHELIDIEDLIKNR